MSANRLVSTRAIQAAVQDRETEVLDRLGLDWRAGRPHVCCPAFFAACIAAKKALISPKPSGLPPFFSISK